MPQNKFLFSFCSFPERGARKTSNNKSLALQRKVSEADTKWVNIFFVETDLLNDFVHSKLQNNVPNVFKLHSHSNKVKKVLEKNMFCFHFALKFLMSQVLFFPFLRPRKIPVIPHYPSNQLGMA
jgi:hypothetical protein